MSRPEARRRPRGLSAAPPGRRGRCHRRPTGDQSTQARCPDLARPEVPAAPRALFSVSLTSTGQFQTGSGTHHQPASPFLQLAAQYAEPSGPLAPGHGGWIRRRRPPGRDHRAPDAVAAWRGGGIEPADDAARRPPVLKTGGASGRPDASGADPPGAPRRRGVGGRRHRKQRVGRKSGNPARSGSGYRRDSRADATSWPAAQRSWSWTGAPQSRCSSSTTGPSMSAAYVLPHSSSAATSGNNAMPFSVSRYSLRARCPASW